MTRTINPDKLDHPNFKTFLGLYKYLIKQEISTDKEIIIEFYKDISPPFGEKANVQMIQYNITPCHLKSKCFDEMIESGEAIEMSQDVVRQALFATSALRDQFMLKDLADWLEPLAISKRKEMIFGGRWS